MRPQTRLPAFFRLPRPWTPAFAGVTENVQDDFPSPDCPVHGWGAAARSPHRECNVENAAGARFGFHPDPPAVVLDDLLADGQADAGAFVLARACRRWKIRKMRSKYSGVDADAVVGDGDDPVAARRRAGRHRHCAGAGRAARYLRALPIRFWNSRTSSPRSPDDGGQVAASARSSASASSIGIARLARAPPPPLASRPTVRIGARLAADARIVQQVEDQAVHPLGAVAGEGDELAAVVVEQVARSGARAGRQ